MGVWWQQVWVDVPKLTVRFAGDPSAVPKTVPILWRYGQDWHYLQVSGMYEEGYRLYFAGNNFQMSHRKLLTARFVAVREGPEPVAFWAEDKEGRQVELLKTGRMEPAHRFRPDRSSPEASSLDYIHAIGTVVKV